MDEKLTSQMPYLRTIAMRFCHECTAAGLGTDDLAQETILRASAAADSMPQRDSDLQRYLHRMMANLLHDRLDAARAQKRGGGHVASLDELLAGMAEATLRLEGMLRAQGPGPRTLAHRRDARAQITAALEALPVKQRAAVTLHLVHEFSLEDTAGAMGTSVGQVRGYVQRGREELRAMLRDLWEER